MALHGLEDIKIHWMPIAPFTDLALSVLSKERPRGGFSGTFRLQGSFAGTRSIIFGKRPINPQM
jgi:hypothetical protein